MHGKNKYNCFVLWTRSFLCLGLSALAKLSTHDKRDVFTNTKQIYFRHAIKEAFRGEIETYRIIFLFFRLFFLF